MEKAYDLKDLTKKLQSRGLPVAEEVAEQVVHAMFEWLDESAPLSPSKMDDLVSQGYPIMKAAVLKAINKIDGNPA